MHEHDTKQQDNYNILRLIVSVRTNWMLVDGSIYQL